MRRYDAKGLRSATGGKSPMTIHRWERSRGFPRHVQINGRNFWDADAVDSWLAASESAPICRLATKDGTQDKAPPDQEVA